MSSLRFSGAWPFWFILLLGLAGSIGIARWYWRESRHLPNPLRWTLPALRALAFFLIILMLSGPTVYYQRIQGELSRIRVLVDVSMSMTSLDDPASGESRLSRVWRLLRGGGTGARASRGWLEELGKYHRVEVIALNRTSSNTPLWDSLANADFPDVDSIEEHGASSPLGENLFNANLDSSQPKNANGALAATILISDGQLNAGIGMEEAASSYLDAKIPIFTVGVGSSAEPEDLGILAVEHSQRVYRLDRFRGAIMLKERMNAGTPYRVEIKQYGETIFSSSLKSDDQGVRRIEFEIPAESLIDKAKDHLQVRSDYSMIPLELDFSVRCEAPEIGLANNSFASSLWGIEKRNRVLILDRRGGWEMRYIKNAMERDATWDCTVAVGRGAFDKEYFPSARAKLFEFDLIIASFDTVRYLDSLQQNWISDFVGTVGGGLVLIDSPRQSDHKNEWPVIEESLLSLLPVSWRESADGILPQSIQVSSLAKNQPALQLSSEPLPNDQAWSRLPPPHSLRAVQVKPGAEVLIEAIGAKAEDAHLPLVVTKIFGQGRVLYFASDETWRWRYDVADLYHQRFWNQIAAWGMRPQFAVRDDFACLDSGPRVYSTEDSISVRASLKQNDSAPLENAFAHAIVERNGVPHLTVPLAENIDAPGFYQANFGPLPKGSYQVRLEVDGVPVEAMKLQTEFIVQAPIDIEMQTLACNPATLKQASNMTGGEFVMIDEAASILDKLRPFRVGEIVESQILLWQSYPWFGTIIGLLTIEWFLRKRAGLV